MSTSRPPRLSDIVVYHQQRRGDSEFLIHADHPGPACSYSEFASAVETLATQLRELGLSPRERCALHLPNSPAMLAALFAVLAADAVAVPTIVAYSAEELEYVLGHCGASAVLSTEALASKIDGGRRHTLDVLGEQLVHVQTGRHARADGEEEAVVMYTSGTTARPKGVRLSHRSLIFAGEAYADILRLHPQDTVLTCMPLFHINGLCLQLLPAIITGTRYVLAEVFSVSRYWDWVQAHEVTVGHLVAGPVRLLLSEPEPVTAPRSLRAMSFALPLRAEEIAAFEARFGVPLSMAWGQTETSCGATFVPLGFGRKPGHQCLGPDMRGWEVKVVDEHGRLCEVGQTGELLVRSPAVMLGYLDDEQATASTLVDGWVHTGDIGWRDELGELHFLDRLKDMIKPSGENVAASEVEEALASHPDVAEASVIGVPDEIRGEAIVAFVIPERDGDPSEQQLREHVAARLAAFKVPVRVLICSELPRTAVGKVAKGELRAHAATLHIPTEKPRKRR